VRAADVNVQILGMAMSTVTAEPASADTPSTAAAVDFRTELIAAIAAGNSPPGGPRLSIDEIEFLRQSSGPVSEMILSLRILEWQAMEADADTRTELQSELDSREQELVAIRATLWEENDLAGTKALQIAESALALCFGQTPVGMATELVGDARQVKFYRRPQRRRKAKRGWSIADFLTERPSRVQLAVLGTCIATMVAALLILGRSRLQLPGVVPPPTPSELSAELVFGDMNVVAGVVYAETSTWQQLDEDSQRRTARNACNRVFALGFRGLVLLDPTGVKLTSCSLKRPNGAEPETKG